MFSEDDLLPISALQHMLFCERQCALIHVERLWAENRLTVEGQHLHRRAHSAAASEWRDQVLAARGLRLRSLRLRLHGQADVVEFHVPPGAERQQFLTALQSQALAGEIACLPAGCLPPSCTVTPIEYKRGQPKKDNSDKVQLCAQAICLEEMLGVEIAFGGIFYGKRRRRLEVQFDRVLRDLTEQTARRLHHMFDSRETPVARREPKCESCSLVSLCMPDAFESSSAAAFAAHEFDKHLASDGPVADPFELAESPS